MVQCFRAVKTPFIPRWWIHGVHLSKAVGYKRQEGSQVRRMDSGRYSISVGSPGWTLGDTVIQYQRRLPGLGLTVGKLYLHVHGILNPLYFLLTYLGTQNHTKKTKPVGQILKGTPILQSWCGSSFCLSQCLDSEVSLVACLKGTASQQ